jgi:steroid delta-isomerase-like uncharacterized protein
VRMSADENRAVVRRWVEAWNEKDLNAAEELLGLDYVRHDANLPEVVGPQAERQFVAGVIAAFPDLHLQTEQLVAEDDLVVIRVTVRGTHRAEFMGVPPSDRRVKFQAVEIYRLSDAKIAEQWVVTDILGLLQQLGAVPSGG